MKRTCLLSTAAFAALTISSVASAETKPAVLWIPTAEIELTPSSQEHCRNAMMSDDVAAAGCVGGLAEATTRAPHPEADAIVAGVTTAFEPYNIRVVTEAPPEYMPAFALLPSDAELEESVSHTCSGAGLTCAARGRDSVGFTNGGGGANCSDPDVVQSAIYAVGRMTGLEGKDDPTDAMHYPPDYDNPALTFVDACGTVSAFLGGDKGDTPAPFECTVDHVDCDNEIGDDMPEQNSHADLIEYFGAAVEDTTPPSAKFNNLEDGASLAEGEPLVVIADLDDDSGYVAMRYTIESPSLEALPDAFPLGNITVCTTALCDVNLLDGNPFKEANSSWASPELGLPPGEYTITLEASDYAGNEIDPIVISVTLEGELDPTDSGGSDSDSDTDGGGSDSDTATATASDTNDSGFVTDSAGSDSDSDSDTDDGGGDGGQDSGGDSGCHVGPAKQAGSTFVLLMGLLGLGFVRRRR